MVCQHFSDLLLVNSTTQDIGVDIAFRAQIVSCHWPVEIGRSDHAADGITCTTHERHDYRGPLLAVPDTQSSA